MHINQVAALRAWDFFFLWRLMCADSYSAPMLIWNTVLGVSGVRFTSECDMYKSFCVLVTALCCVSEQLPHCWLFSKHRCIFIYCCLYFSPNHIPYSSASHPFCVWLRLPKNFAPLPPALAWITLEQLCFSAQGHDCAANSLIHCCTKHVLLLPLLLLWAGFQLHPTWWLLNAHRKYTALTKTQN